MASLVIPSDSLLLPVLKHDMIVLVLCIVPHGQHDPSISTERALSEALVVVIGNPAYIHQIGILPALVVQNPASGHPLVPRRMAYNVRPQRPHIVMEDSIAVHVQCRARDRRLVGPTAVLQLRVVQQDMADHRGCVGLDQLPEKGMESVAAFRAAESIMLVHRVADNVEADFLWPLVASTPVLLSEVWGGLAQLQHLSPVVARFRVGVCQILAWIDVQVQNLGHRNVFRIHRHVRSN